VRDIHLDGLDVEGTVNCAFRVEALSSTAGVQVDHLHVDGWNDLDPSSQANYVKAHTDMTGESVSIGDGEDEEPALQLCDFQVGGDVLTREEATGLESPGRVDMPEDSGAWDAVAECGR
jgi:hypothetical protein